MKKEPGASRFRLFDCGLEVTDHRFEQVIRHGGNDADELLFCAAASLHGAGKKLDVLLYACVHHVAFAGFKPCAADAKLAADGKNELRGWIALSGFDQRHGILFDSDTGAKFFLSQICIFPYRFDPCIR